MKKTEYNSPHKPDSIDPVDFILVVFRIDLMWQRGHSGCTRNIPYMISVWS